MKIQYTYVERKPLRKIDSTYFTYQRTFKRRKYYYFALMKMDGKHFLTLHTIKKNIKKITLIINKQTSNELKYK